MAASNGVDLRPLEWTHLPPTDVSRVSVGDRDLKSVEVLETGESRVFDVRWF
jgi:hypothetical protein